jgi:hypothetical protein
MLPWKESALQGANPAFALFWTLEKDENMPEFFRYWVTTTLVSPLQRRPEPPQLEPANAEYPCLLGDILSIPPNSLRFIGSGRSPDNLLPKMFKFFLNWCWTMFFNPW